MSFVKVNLVLKTDRQTDRQRLTNKDVYFFINQKYKRFTSLQVYMKLLILCKRKLLRFAKFNIRIMIGEY